MIHPGLVSITFRQLAPREIVELVVRAGLRGIEWGGDRHVPHGDLARAREVRGLTLDAGLEVASYGSYYRAGTSPSEGLDFNTVLDTAAELGAPTIRVWAGTVASAECTESDRERIALDLRRIAGLAEARGLTVSCEYHDNTLHDRAESTVASLRRVAHPALLTYWQPRHAQPPQTGLDDIRQLAPWLSHLHVFQWWPDSKHRFPLADGHDRWQAYLREIAAIPGSRHALLEFAVGDSPQAFLADAVTLKKLLEGLK